MLDIRVYGHEEWAKHKSSFRHGRHLFSFLSSGLMCTLAPPVVTCTLLATCVTVVNHSWVGGVLRLEVSAVPLVLTSAVLSLLLVFRTNSSYNRYDEARKMWAGNVNRGRDLARQGLTWIRSPKDSSNLSCMLRHVKAYSFCLQHHLTEHAANSLDSTLQPIMAPQELAALLSAPHRPVHVLQILSKLLNQVALPELQKMAMDDNLTAFHDNLGACERIFKTSIPIAYTLVVSRFLILWHLVLPFALSRECGWLTIPAAFLTSTALFYIEAVGVLIEEPFWILPLGAMAEGLAADVDELVQAHAAAAVPAAEMVWSERSVVQITVGKDADIGHVMLRKTNTIA